MLEAEVLGSGLIVSVMIIRAVFKKMPASLRCVLWLIVAVRLMMPMSFVSDYGVLQPWKSIVSGLAERMSDIKGYGNQDGMMTNYAGNEQNSNPRNKLENGQGEVDADADGFRADIATQTTNYADHDLIGVEASPQYDEIINAIFIVRILGTLLLLAYMIFSAVRLRFRVRYAVPKIYNDEECENPGIKYFLSDEISTPFLFGIVNPRIYIPSGVEKNNLPHIIRHELAHKKRGDNITKLLFFVVASVHWFNPLAWIAYALYGRDMEVACDDMVIGRYEVAQRQDYAEALLSVALAKPTPSLSAFPVAFGELPIKDRVEHVTKYNKSSLMVVAASVIACMALGFLFYTVRAEAGEEIISNIDIILYKYQTVKSEHYTLIPDDEEYCYRIYDVQGNQIGGIVPYADAIAVENDGAGERYLFSFYKDNNAYMVTSLDDELEEDLKQAMGEKLWHLRLLSDYTINSAEATGLSYIVRNGDRAWEGHVMLWDDADVEAYDAIAEEYGKKYVEVLLDEDVGYTYADMEVKGLSHRFNDGFLILRTGTLMYIASEEPSSVWGYELATDEYDRLVRWLVNNKGRIKEMDRYDSWTPVFDELGIEYDEAINTNRQGYMAAFDRLNDRWTAAPPQGISEKRAADEIREVLNDGKNNVIRNGGF